MSKEDKERQRERQQFNSLTQGCLCIVVKTLHMASPATLNPLDL